MKKTSKEESLKINSKTRVTALLWLANYIHYNLGYLANRHIDLEKIRVKEIEELYLEFNPSDTSGNKEYRAILTHLPSDFFDKEFASLKEICDHTEEYRDLAKKSAPVDLEAPVYLKAGTVLVPLPEYAAQMMGCFGITEYVVTEEHEKQNATLGERWMIKQN